MRQETVTDFGTLGGIDRKIVGIKINLVDAKSGINQGADEVPNHPVAAHSRVRTRPPSNVGVAARWNDRHTTAARDSISPILSNPAEAVKVAFVLPMLPFDAKPSKGRFQSPNVQVSVHPVEVNEAFTS